jgi:microcystin degradation protein MlrC
MAAYAPVAKGGFLHVDTPGVTRADMTKLDYHQRRKPMFPFERDASW